MKWSHVVVVMEVVPCGCGDEMVLCGCGDEMVICGCADEMVICGCGGGNGHMCLLWLK